MTAASRPRIRSSNQALRLSVSGVSLRDRALLASSPLPEPMPVSALTGSRSLTLAEAARGRALSLILPGTPLRPRRLTAAAA